jgi:hypothetical protein
VWKTDSVSSRYQRGIRGCNILDEDGIFDIVHTSEILAHTYELGKAIDEMVRLARKSYGVSALTKANEA